MKYANPHCEICGGSGFVYPLDNYLQPIYRKAVVCPGPDCYGSYLYSFKETVLNKQTFDTFIVDGNREKYPKVKEALINSMRFASYWATGEGNTATPFLVLLGGTGVGKTHLCNAIFLRMYKNKPCRIWNVGDFYSFLQAGIKDNQVHDRIKEAESAPALIFDDIKKEYTAQFPWATETMEAIINKRSDLHLPTVLTSNDQLEDLPARLADRLRDRERSTIVVIHPCDSYRPTKKRRK
jgi:DNA replication protein DnaC